jgi:bacterioferritin-associated ferredoxin
MIITFIIISGTEMYVCICNAVTVSEVRCVIEGGARTVEAVTAACRAGGDCGSCTRRIERMLQEAAPSKLTRHLPIAPDDAAERAA